MGDRIVVLEGNVKDLFPGYYKPDEAFFTRLWAEAIFVFDANVLLDIFRYSPETVEQILKFLEDNKERIWLPHQAALEFHNNLLNVIASQKREYKEAETNINSLLEIFKKERGHPFLDEELFAKLSEVLRSVKDVLKEKKTELKGLYTINPVKDIISKLYSGKVGQEYDKKKLNELFKVGAERYNNDIPPGYKDKKKPNNKKYGDFILWQQILDYAKDNNQGIILVTSDYKEDWFVDIDGNTIGPRPELIKEFKDNKDIPFYLYQTDSFFEYANQYISSKIPEQTISEVKERKEETIQQTTRSLGLSDVYVGNLSKAEKTLQDSIYRPSLADMYGSDYLRAQKALQDSIFNSGWGVVSDEDEEPTSEDDKQSDETNGEDEVEGTKE